MLATITEVGEVRWGVRLLAAPPRDCGFLLFSALCRIGWLRHAEPEAQVLPFWGSDGRPTLALRLPARRAAEAENWPCPEWLDVGGGRVAIEDAVASSLRPAASLESPLVTIKGKMDAVALRGAVLSQLALLSVTCRVIVGRRNAIHVKSNAIVGYAVRLERLNPEASIAVQSRGIGGRMRFGCGVFAPC